VNKGETSIVISILSLKYSELSNYIIVSFIFDFDWNPTRTTVNHPKRTISTKCYIHTVVPPDGGPGYARNVERLTKYTKNKLCIKLVFLYTVNKTLKIFYEPLVCF
jgi:hypothetical protein